MGTGAGAGINLLRGIMGLITIRKYHINTSAIQYAVQMKDKVHVYFHGDKVVIVTPAEWEAIAATFQSPIIPPAGTA